MDRTKAKETSERPDYLSYLLRLWRVREGKGDVWRASLQHPGSGERVRFRTLEALFGFLRRETGAAQDAEANGEADLLCGPAPGSNQIQE